MSALMTVLKQFGSQIVLNYFPYKYSEGLEFTEFTICYVIMMNMFYANFWLKWGRLCGG